MKMEKLIKEIDDTGIKDTDNDIKGTMKAWVWGAKQAKKDSDVL